MEFFKGHLKSMLGESEDVSTNSADIVRDIQILCISTYFFIFKSSSQNFMMKERLLSVMKNTKYAAIMH